ncbi:glycosyltransferase [Glaciecola sp. 33A]|uniref:glycosyltransferase n=1 Tax=Glaciecola sp. 33A TaxID=2057807 RepID=UPI000C33DD2B|nr:glycosyltransferase [Glaciecola sp. 33A]PKI02365.1 glycosyltransferase [Glaciecola sp. 33A]
MNKKKILHVTYDMRIGGTEMVIKNIIEGVDTAKFQMSIFCIEQPIGPWGQELEANGTTIHSKNRKEGFDFSMIASIRKVLTSEKIDVIHCHQYSPWVYGVIAAIGLHTKVIFTEHGRFYPDSSSWKRKFVNPILSFFTDSITTISKATKQALVDYEFLSANKIDIIYNGIKALKTTSVEERQALKSELFISDDDIVLGTVARLDPIKNHAMMLDAFNSVLKNYPSAKLVIVGDGELSTALKEQCNELNISDKVIFTGYITNPSNYIQIFDIFLLSSLSEGTSMTLLEAMSVGKPCVVTDAGGNSEIISNESNGLVTENKICKSFSLAIEELMLNEAKRLLMGNRGFKRYEQFFSSMKMSSEYMRHYY